MDRRELGGTRCQSHEALNRIVDEGDTDAISLAFAGVPDCPVPPATRLTKRRGSSVSFGIQNSTLPSRNDTFASAESTALSIVDPAWEKQYVLSFDGGGIRGYSSLLILQRLMDIIAEKEIEFHTKDNKGIYAVDTHTSYYPLQPPPSPDNAEPGDEVQEIGGQFAERERAKRRRRRRQHRRCPSPVRNSLVDGPNHSESTEARVKRSRYLPCHYFDYMGGTSTGGLISIFLGRLRMPIDNVIDFYELLGGSLFGHPRFFSMLPSWSRPIPFPRDKYGSARVVDVVEKVIRDQASKQVTNCHHDLLFTSNNKMCKTIVVSTAGQIVEDVGPTKPGAPYIFRTYDHHRYVGKEDEPGTRVERNPGYSQQIPIWEVARATSAAPTYFDSITINNRKYGDGGFRANNPTHEIFKEVCHMNGNDIRNIGLLLSIGTGQSKQWSRFGTGVFSKYMKYFKAARIFAADSQKTHEGMRRIAMDQFPYYRFDVPYMMRRQSPLARAATSAAAGGSDSGPTGTGHKKPRQRKAKRLGNMKFDEWKPPCGLSRRKCDTTLFDIKSATETYLSDPEVQSHLDHVARELVLNRLARSHTDYWDLVSTGTLFRCTHEGCYGVKAQNMGPRENNLRSHLSNCHGGINSEELDDYVPRGEFPYRPPDTSAAKSRSNNAIKVSVKRRADINVVDEDGRTALHDAVMVGSKDSVKDLLKRGADINSVDSSGRTALHYATRVGSRDIVKELSQCGADISMADKEGCTVLHHAAGVGSRDIIQELLQCGADVRVADSNGRTPLHHAVGARSVEAIEMLINHGADISAIDNSGRTILCEAVMTNSLLTVQCLLTYFANRSSRQAPDVSLEGRESRAESHPSADMAAEGADTTARFPDTILHTAAAVCSEDIVRLLLAKGADANAKNDALLVPLQVARQRMAKALLHLVHQPETGHSYQPSLYVQSSRAVVQCLEDVSTEPEEDVYHALRTYVGEDCNYPLAPEWVTCEWELPSVYHRLEPGHTIQTIVVLTGCGLNYEATTCEKYLITNWGDIGKEVLESITDNLSKSSSRSYSNVGACIEQVIAEYSNITVFYYSDSPKLSRLRATEALVWLCQAIRMPEDFLCFSTAAFAVDAVTLPPNIRHHSVISERLHVFYSFSLKPLQPLRNFGNSSHNCWWALFKCGVIARRKIDRVSGPGLEIPFNLMISLATVEVSVLLDGGMILVGYSTALVPIAKNGNDVRWHLEATEDGQINPRNLTSTQSTWLKVDDYRKLADARCILGWCNVAHIVLGTKNLQEEVQWSGQRPRGKTLHWAGISLTGQLTSAAPIQAGGQLSMIFSFVINRQRFPAAGVYSQMLSDTSGEVAVVLDAEAKRAWMVPKLSLLLHMSHMYVRYRDLANDPIPYANPDPDGGKAARLVLNNSGSIAVLPSQRGDTLHLRQLLLGLNINLHESKSVLEESKGSNFFGVEFMDLVTQPPAGGTMRHVKLRSVAKKWTGILCAADAVVVCAGLGEAIKPGTDHQNGGCISLPCGLDYLAATLHCLSVIIKRQGDDVKNLSNGRVRMTYRKSWQIRGDPFQSCPHHRNSTETCWDRKDLYQRIDRDNRSIVFLSSLYSRAAVAQCVLTSMDGAVVFGDNCNKVKWSDSLPPGHGFDRKENKTGSRADMPLVGPILEPVMLDGNGSDIERNMRNVKG